jgi:hypothetical protein
MDRRVDGPPVVAVHRQEETAVGNPYAPPSGDRTRPGVLPPSDEKGPPSAPGPGPRRTHPDQEPPAGAGRPPAPPARRPDPDPAAARATSRRILHFGMLLLAAILASTLPLPWQVGALGFVVAALVVGMRALVLAWRDGVRGAVVPLLGLGLVSAGLVALTVLSLMLVWPQQLARQECLAGAVTIAATERCQAEFRRAVEERLTPPSPGD